jgi:hypothetical protein
LAAKVINNLRPLTKQSRVKVFILDDSTIARNRSKKVELLTRIFDHVSHKFVKGFTLLTLGWSDGYSFTPLAFNLLSSAKDSNRYQKISVSIDHRTNGYIEIANGFATENTETIKSKLKDWITSKTRFVQALFANLCWES